MIYYLIRHKQSGEFMPQAKNGKGYSHWKRLGDDFDQGLKTPRLFESEKKAKKSIVEWAKGYFIWHYPADMFDDAKRVWINPGRSKDDLEVLIVNLVEMK